MHDICQTSPELAALIARAELERAQVQAELRAKAEAERKRQALRSENAAKAWERRWDGFEIGVRS